jgi:hypothetical protein
MRNIKIIIGVVVCVAALFTFMHVLHGAAGIDQAERAQVHAAAAPVSPQPSAEELAVRASRFDVMLACGKPARVWMTASGRGQYERDTWHLWYPNVPAEIIVAADPAGPPLEHFWKFEGGSPSLASDDFYDSAKLAKKMPCVAKWANVFAKLDSPKFN